MNDTRDVDQDTVDQNIIDQLREAWRQGDDVLDALASKLKVDPFALGKLVPHLKPAPRDDDTCDLSAGA